MFRWKSVFLYVLFVWYCEAMICDLENSKVTCKNMTTFDFVSEIYVRIQPDDIFNFDISNSRLVSIHKSMFSRFGNLHSLCLNNNSIKIIDRDSFADLMLLTNLKLTNNQLLSFDFSVIPSKSSIRYIDLSGNRIESLNNFNSINSDYLSILNVSSNNLTFLPKEIIQKLKTDENFYLVAEKNPWNCSSDLWNLDATLVTAFCGHNVTAVATPAVQNLNLNANKANDSREGIDIFCGYEKKCFSYCVFWFLGGIWLGVILGNVCKLNRLMCATGAGLNQEQNTQYDWSLSRRIYYLQKNQLFFFNLKYKKAYFFGATADTKIC